jgi:hypothetical protein
MTNFNFHIILFKNNKKKKIIKSFITFDRCKKYYDNLIKKSNEIKYEKQYENGIKCDFKLCLVSNKKNFELNNIFYRDSLGRQQTINPKITDDLYIKEINDYNIEELIFDLQTNKKITLLELFKNYMKNDNLHMISKINNKFVIQVDENFSIFSLKNEEDCFRFLNNFHMYNDKKNYMIVLDLSSPQKKYLYRILEEKGFNTQMLYRKSTTHPK